MAGKKPTSTREHPVSFPAVAAPGAPKALAWGGLLLAGVPFVVYLATALFEAFLGVAVDRMTVGDAGEGDRPSDFYAVLRACDDWLSDWYWVLPLVIGGAACWLARRAVRSREEAWEGKLYEANLEITYLNPADARLRLLRSSWQRLNEPETRSGRESKTAADRLVEYAERLRGPGVPVSDLEGDPNLQATTAFLGTTALKAWESDKLVVHERVPYHRLADDAVVDEQLRRIEGVDRDGLVRRYFLTEDGGKVVAWQQALIKRSASHTSGSRPS